jgi:glycine betaine/proline transport system substrate-binding protein
MTAALKRAIARDEWIVVTGWSPHWKFGAWDLRYIEDPKTVLGRAERVHAMAREDFYQENIDAAMTLSRMWIPLEDLQTYMYKARQSSYEEAAAAFIEDNPERIDYWVNGGMPPDS